MKHPVITLSVWAALLQVASGAEPIIILIGGNHSDPSPAQLEGAAGRSGNSGLWRLKGDLLSEQKLSATYFNWNGTAGGRIDDPHPGGPHKIARVVRREHAERPDEPIIIVGNSWGGHTAVAVCRLLNGETVPVDDGRQQSIDSSSSEPVKRGVDEPRPSGDDASAETDGFASATECQTINSDDSDVLNVDLLIFLDPSSLGRSKEPKPTKLSANVIRAVNYFTHNSFGWREWPDEPRIENVDLGDSENGFLYPGGPKYDSALNWAAHVSAEWDERIHADIRDRIREQLVPTDGKVPPGN